MEWVPDLQKPGEENDYRLCPLKLHALLSTPEAVMGTSDYRGGVKCNGNICAWYDQTAGRCAVLSIARSK